MNNEIKAFLDNEYGSIYGNLNKEWLLGLKKEKQMLMQKGLKNSGIEQRQLCDYAIKLINNNIENVKSFIIESQKKFNFLMSEEEIEEYIDKSIKNCDGYLKLFEKELMEYFNKGKHLFSESCAISFNNAKANIRNDFEKIKKEIILINKSNKKDANKKEKKKLSVGDIIEIIGIVVAIIGIIISIVF